MKATLSLVMGLFLMVFSCSPVKVDEYAGGKPALDVREFFNGEIDAHGIFYNHRGKAEQQFHLTMKCNWQGDEGTLEEEFVYLDGKKDSRVWKLKFIDDNNFTGTAHDVIGVAKGRQVGNSANMKYTLRLPVGDKVYDLVLDDWMYKLSDTEMMNRIHMRKFGIKVGEVIVVFRKK